MTDEPTITVTVDGRYELSPADLEPYGLPADFTDADAAKAVREWWFATTTAARLIVEVTRQTVYQSESLPGIDPVPVAIKNCVVVTL